MRYAVDASGVGRAHLTLSGEDLESVADCVREAFERFRPCQSMARGEAFELPLLFSPGG